jgi:NADH-quinone oxidoreductase subunit K
LLDGYTFILFVLAIAAAEVAVGLGLSVLVFYRVGSITLERIARMRG